MKNLQKHAIIGLLICCATIAAAQKPRITNAKVQELSASSGLKGTIDGLVQKQTGPLWIGYRIPAAAKERTMCCFDSWDGLQGANEKCCMGCKLESASGSSFSGTNSDCTPPEPLPYAFVFFRAEDRQIRKVRAYSADCPLDFANLPLYWLEDVKPEQSVELLSAMALASDSEGTNWDRHPAHQAVMAIAMHDTPAADAALEKLIQPGQRISLRENVAFWLGVERGKKGLELLRKYVLEDPDDHMREKGTFAFSQSKEPEALKDLISMARHDQSSRVRGQAIFWLAQKGSRKAAQEITDAIENDPETDVKKKAVFALSQMHDAEAVPRLINVAKTNKNPVVRKQAIFWLGQMNDPRALDFLEEILTK
ncbi:MAG TPA: HEAT repeat domain-containing protein [Candidatus Angelobacter sp.]|nr:HEAT repeat domain-containing protein [Candidatus Angelobacter sp.]